MVVQHIWIIITAIIIIHFLERKMLRKKKHTPIIKYLYEEGVGKRRAA